IRATAVGFRNTDWPSGPPPPMSIRGFTLSRSLPTDDCLDPEAGGLTSAEHANRTVKARGVSSKTVAVDLVPEVPTIRANLPGIMRYSARAPALHFATGHRLARTSTIDRATILSRSC